MIDLFFWIVMFASSFGGHRPVVPAPAHVDNPIFMGPIDLDEAPIRATGQLI
jgi:hypothetical protein